MAVNLFLCDYSMVDIIQLRKLCTYLVLNGRGKAVLVSRILLDLTNEIIGVKYRSLPKWRNRQTRYVQGVVGFTPVWVRLPPSALVGPEPNQDNVVRFLSKLRFEGKEKVKELQLELDNRELW